MRPEHDLVLRQSQEPTVLLEKKRLLAWAEEVERVCPYQCVQRGISLCRCDVHTIAREMKEAAR